MVTGSAFIHEQFETSPETIEQVLRPAELLLTPTERFYENYGIDNGPARFNGTHLWDRFKRGILKYGRTASSTFYNCTESTLGAIQVLRHSDGGGGGSYFPEKALRRCNVQCY